MYRKGFFFFRWIMTRKILIITSFLILFCGNTLFAENENKAENALQNKVSHLIFIKKNILRLQNEIKKLQADLEIEVSEELKAEVQKDLVDLNKRYRNAKTNYLETAAGVNLESARDIKPVKKDLLEELRELLSPLLDSFHQLSERPRKIERYKSEISALKEKITLTERAINNIDALILFKDNQEILNDLKEAKEKSRGMLEGLNLNLEAFQRQLDQETKTDESFLETATKALKDFFRNRGKNLFISIISFFSIWWAMSAICSRIFKADIFTEPLAWVKKPLKALYNLISISLAIIGTLFSLYLLNDWVLLTFFILVLSVIAWTSRQWAPKFLEEGRIILNLGTVREGERIIWEGVPWLVRDLGFYSTLINKELQGAHLKVAASELIGMYSRPVVKDEPWFPTRKGHWVLLSDETYGKILIQTPEQVVVEVRGGAHKYYSTTDFLAQKPKNISLGFRIAIEFGLDYSHQPRICDDVPGIFLKGMKSLLHHRISGNDPDFINPTVEFHSAGESSLNLWVKVDCPGRIAHIYPDLFREMQTCLVKICNENGFTIPFNQLTVHMPEKDGS